MTDKEAIEILRKLYNYQRGRAIPGADDYIFNKEYKAIETVLNLIQTQQEEIETEKKKNIHYEKLISNGLASKEIAKIDEETQTVLRAEIEKKDKIVRSIISRLNNDIKNIAETKAKKNEHYLDDHTRCRLKAYKTKTREIKEYIEKEYFTNKSEKENKDE